MSGETSSFIDCSAGVTARPWWSWPCARSLGATCRCCRRVHHD